MQVGFVVLLREEQEEIQLFGQHPDGPSCLATHARHGRQHAIVMGRLRYRSELIEQLPSTTFASGPPDDAELTLAAYRHWGPKGLAHLEGDFALVVWDPDQKRLLGSRDPLGGYPLFWTKLPDGIAMGTCQRPLLRLLSRRTLNLDYLAEYLALPAAMFHEPATRHCVYQGLHRVGPGCIVQARLPGGHVQEECYWSWLDRMVDPGTDRLEELGELVATG